MFLFFFSVLSKVIHCCCLLPCSLSRHFAVTASSPQDLGPHKTTPWPSLWRAVGLGAQNSRDCPQWGWGGDVMPKEQVPRRQCHHLPDLRLKLSSKVMCSACKHQSGASWKWKPPHPPAENLCHVDTTKWVLFKQNYSKTIQNLMIMLGLSVKLVKSLPVDSSVLLKRDSSSSPERHLPTRENGGLKHSELSGLLNWRARRFS